MLANFHALIFAFSPLKKCIVLLLPNSYALIILPERILIGSSLLELGGEGWEGKIYIRLKS